MLWTTNRQDISNADYVDDIVSAEIPNAEQFPELHDVVTMHMMHGPCGENTSATCMKPSVSEERRCRFHFPFQPRKTTLIPDNGREPLYRRRCQTTIIKRGRLMDDRWVASYNALLLLKYRAHINVIVCTGSSPVKWLKLATEEHCNDTVRPFATTWDIGGITCAFAI